MLSLGLLSVHEYLLSRYMYLSLVFFRVVENGKQIINRGNYIKSRKTTFLRGGGVKGAATTGILKYHSTHPI
jgi:hypothetical protein